MRLPDGRRVYTASCGTRVEWLSGRRAPLYRCGLQVCNNNQSILNDDNDHVCPRTFLHSTNQYQCIPLQQLPRTLFRKFYDILWGSNLTVKSCNISFRHSLRILINWVTHMIAKVPKDRILEMFQITPESEVDCPDHNFVKTKRFYSI